MTLPGAGLISNRDAALISIFFLKGLSKAHLGLLKHSFVWKVLGKEFLAQTVIADSCLTYQYLLLFGSSGQMWVWGCFHQIGVLTQ